MDAAQELELEILSHQKEMNAVIDEFSSPVQQFYCGASVFVTGASGFLGKHLIEKIFRSTKVAKVYVLLRSKKGKTIRERLNQMLEDPVYDGLRQRQRDFADRIVPIEGDVAEVRLGISDKELDTLTGKVDVIIHMAATTRFDESLRVATLINVRGTREALLLAKACKRLRSFVHVSTAYTYACDTLIDTDVEESFYPCPVDPAAMIQIAETTDENRLNNMAPALTENWPNTYTFAKAEAEELVRTMGANLPICVVRPAVVVAAYYEPSPGWVDICLELVEFARLSKKLYRMCIALSYFTVNQWRFVDNNLEALYNRLAPADKAVYNFDVTKIDWTEFLYAWWLGLRKYILKDGLSGSKRAQSNLKWLRVAHYIWMCIYMYLWYIIARTLFNVLSYILNLFW